MDTVHVLPPPATQEPSDREPRWTLTEHLEELRRRLGISLMSCLLGVGFSLTQVDHLIGWLTHPVAEVLPRLSFFSPIEPLLAYLRVSLLSGVVLSLPVMLWHIWRFVHSGLTTPERRWGMLFVVGGSLQFLVGATFAYTLLLPVSLKLLLQMGMASFTPVISIDQYLSFVTALLLWCGLLFELPLVLILLARMGIVTTEWLRQQRPYAILALVALVAVVTPTTDPVTLLLMATPMVLLYELAILLLRFATILDRGC